MTNSINGLGYGGDDFYSSQLAQAAQQAAANTQTQAANTNPAATQTFQGRQQPTADTFERQGGGTDWGTNLALAGVAGAGTTGALYQWGTKPVNAEGKLTDGFAKEFGNEYSSIVKQEAQEAVFKTKGKLSSEILDELKTLADGGEVKDLSKEAKAYAKKYGVTNAKTAETFVKGVENEIGQIANPKDIALQTQRLEKLQGLQKQLEGLPDNQKATLEKFIVDNAEDFGLKGKTEAQLKKEAQKLLTTFTPGEKVEELLTKNAKKLGINPIDNAKLAEEVDNLFTKCDTPENFEKYLKKNAKKLGLEGTNATTTKANIDKILTDNKGEKAVKGYLKTNATKLGIDATDAAKVQAEIQKILASNNSASKLETYLTTNAKALGIEGKDAAATAKRAKALASQGNSQKVLERLLAGRIKVQEANVKSAENIFGNVAKLWNKDKGILNKSSNKQITTACEKGLKNFKWKTAGKVGAAVAAGVAVLGWAFGGNKSQAV